MITVHVSHRIGSDWSSYDAEVEPYGHDYLLLRLEDGSELVLDPSELFEDSVSRFLGGLAQRSGGRG